MPLDADVTALAARQRATTIDPGSDSARSTKFIDGARHLCSLSHVAQPRRVACAKLDGGRCQDADSDDVNRSKRNVAETPACEGGKQPSRIDHDETEAVRTWPARWPPTSSAARTACRLCSSTAQASASAVQEKSRTADFFLSFALTKGAPPACSTSSASCASAVGL